MCTPQCFIAILLLCLSRVYSWDIAVTIGGQLQFYNEVPTVDKETQKFGALTALAYDAVYNMLLFVDKQSDNASIFSYHLDNYTLINPLVKRRSYESIQAMAFDPVTRLLFWTDTHLKSIYSMSLKSGAKNDGYGNLFLKMDDEIPYGIAVDSCRGYVYWTNTNISNPTIERAKFDGSDRRTIISTGIYMPVSIAIDQRTKTLYWADDKEGIHFSIESSDLDGGNKQIVYQDIHHQPTALTVSKDSIYWVDRGFKSLWQYPKNKTNKPSSAKEIDNFKNHNDGPFSVVANYALSDQIEGHNDCKVLKDLVVNKSEINDTFNIPKDAGLFCIHGIKVAGVSQCKCSPGYTGERCEISLCQNYCLHGDCRLSPEGKAMCRCKEGFTGGRCEIEVCYGYCLNEGQCSVKDDAPTCTCPIDFEGSRCETMKLIESITTTHIPEVNSTETGQSGHCNCTNIHNVAIYSDENQVNDGFVESVTCVDGWDSIRDPVIMVLGILSGLLCVACAVLITKVMKLKRRPRIKKRIIVNKNVTPLTARPDQCEITIENCCNMNICETPCFEPRSTIKPTLRASKPGKEEKKNLIANMEYPDDY